MIPTHPDECGCGQCLRFDADEIRAEAVRDMGTEGARDNAIRGGLDDDWRAEMTARRRTGDY